jgi:superfamily II DNA helicase RecQ
MKLNAAQAAERGKTMKIEILVEGKVLVIEAEGAVSVHVRDLSATPAEPVSVPALAVPAFPAVADSIPAVVAESVPATAPPAPVAVAPTTAPADSTELYTRLSALRKDLSAAANVPAFAVFKDITLREMAEKLPQDLESFAKISGVGKSKLEKYGEVFLSVINAEVRGAA